MKRITEISLCNYRAFLNKPGEEDKYKISLPKGENLLIYGENGSGKSSLFKGLKDFFDSAKDETLQPNGNIFSEVEYPETKVKIQISEKQKDDNWILIEELIFSEGGSTTATSANLSNSTKAFLTYRDILETYFLDRNKGENPNLFNLFFEVLLAQLTDDENNQVILDEIKKLNISINTIEKAFNEIKNDHPEVPDEEILEDLKEPINENIRQLNGRFIEILNGLLNDTNIYLDEYFKSNVNIGIPNQYEFLSLEGEFPSFTLNKKLKFVLGYFGNLVDDNYSLFLNEARLSAIAICLYLASVKKESLRIADNLKFLFLDDIFIGVDTSNRIPLLKILADDFKDFQIFISTYDREWFELARRWMNQTDLKFRHIELYEGIDDTVSPPIPFPILIDPSMNYEEKALYHYQKKDYPAAANYLRKASEEKIKKILPRHMQLKENDGEVVEINMLGELYPKFKEFCRINTILIPSLNQFETYTKIIFNSLSHDDLSANHYKSEIKEALKIIGEFDKFKIKKILEPKTLRTALFDKVNTSGIKHNYEIDLQENLYWIQYDVQPAKFSVSSCQLTGASFSDKHPLQVALVRILNEHGYDPQTDYITLCQSIQATHGKKLDVLMTF